MRQRLSPAHALAFALLLGLLLALVQLGMVSLAFEKLGLSHHSAILLLIFSMVGSLINVPLFRLQATTVSPTPIPSWLQGLLRHPPKPFEGFTTIAVNLGGCIFPLAFSLYLIQLFQIPLYALVSSIGLMILISYASSRPISGIGIGMPIFIAPFSAAILALLIYPENSAPLAYICGTLGVLVGADLLRINDIRNMGAPTASIGGAGTFDGIFITGIVAVLLT
jgi:uncharacterized membrane protein